MKNSLIQRMFSSPGKIIITITKVLTCICIVASFLCDFYILSTGRYVYFLGMYVSGQDKLALGIGMIILGPIVLWMLSLPACAFGELADSAAETKRLLAKADEARNKEE